MDAGDDSEAAPNACSVSSGTLSKNSQKSFVINLAPSCSAAG